MVCSYCGTHIWIRSGDSIDNYSVRMNLLAGFETPRESAHYRKRHSREWVEIHWWRRDRRTRRLWFLVCSRCRQDPITHQMPVCKGDWVIGTTGEKVYRPPESWKADGKRWDVRSSLGKFSKLSPLAEDDPYPSSSEVPVVGGGRGGWVGWGRGGWVRDRGCGLVAV